MNGQITINLIEETSVVVNWTTTTTINKLEYSTNNGKTWTQQSVVAGMGDICRISGLSPNTEYKIVLRLSYVNGSSTLSSSTNTLTVTTYNYPHIINISKEDLIIGDSQTIQLYNPLGRNLSIEMSKANTTNEDMIELLYRGVTTNTTEFTFTPNADTLYNSIPNTCIGDCIYTLTQMINSDEGIERDSKSGYTYSVSEDELVLEPVNFTYKDTKSVVSDVLGTDQELVKGLSKLQVTISSANKMVASQGATPVKYTLASRGCNYLEDIPYSEDTIVLDLGTVTNWNVGDNDFIRLIGLDSREAITRPKIYYPIIYDYQKPTVEITGSRLNNFEDETTIKINGTYSPIIKDGINKNTITLEYRYKENDTYGVFEDWQEVTPILDDKNVTCNDIVLSLDKNKSYYFEARLQDSFQQLGGYAFNNCTIDEGRAIFFVSSNKRACYINGQKIVMPFNLPVTTVEDTPSYYLLAKLPTKSDSNGTLRINGFLGDRTSSFKAVIDCLIANRGSLSVTGTWYGKSSAFTYLNDIEVYEQTNGEHWIYLKVKSSINGGVLLDIEGTDILSDEYTYDYVTTPSGTLVYTINNSTLTEIGEAIEDTSWINVSKASGITDGSIGGVPQYRKIGNELFLRGSYAGNKSTSSLLLGTLPNGYRPKVQEYRLVPISGSNVARVYVTTAGNIYLEWILSLTTSSVVTGNFTWVQIDMNFIVDK